MPGFIRVPPAVAEVMVVVGTRPDAIKMLPVVWGLREHPRFRPFVVLTGQHPDLVEDLFDRLRVDVDVNLGVGRPGLTLNDLFASVVSGIEAALFERYGPPPANVNEAELDKYPLACLVHGDTTSAAAAAIAAFHLHIPVLHVEAGLRTGTTLQPFPEELNRQTITRIASFHAAPTQHNAQNLVLEGVNIERIYVTGNTGIDALMWAAAQHVPYGLPELADLEDDEDTRVVTVTAHRRENWGQPLRDIAAGVRWLAAEYPDVRIVLPVHPNPAVADVLHEELAGSANITLAPPLNNLVFSRLLARSTVVITDSGGIQEEAPALDVPVLVLREVTERREGIAGGTLELVGTDPERIVAAARRLLDDEEHHQTVAARMNPYGDGHAADRIVAALASVVFGTPAPPPAAFNPGFSRDAVLDWAGYARETDGPRLDKPGLDKPGPDKFGYTRARGEPPRRSQARGAIPERALDLIEDAPTN